MEIILVFLNRILTIITKFSRNIWSKLNQKRRSSYQKLILNPDFGHISVHINKCSSEQMSEVRLKIN